jgi:hypothetical protein
MGRRTLIALTIACLVLAACSTGPARRVSEPAASIQQLTVRADGTWSVDLRLQNYSSIPMRFDAVALEVEVGGDEAAGTLRHQPGLEIGPESADVVTVAFVPSSSARILVADALAGRRNLDYGLDGTIDAAPADRGNARSYEVERKSALSPVPGLPGVLR